MTNETIASQLAHRTIRAYRDQPLTEEDLDLPQAEYYWNGTVID